MKEVKTKYVDENPDMEKKSKEIRNETKYNFIQEILKNNIGNLIDDFLTTNINNKINKFTNDSFARWAIFAIKQSEQEIIKKFEEIIKNK